MATARAYARSLRALGCPSVRHLPINEQHPADAPATLRRLAAAACCSSPAATRSASPIFYWAPSSCAACATASVPRPGFVVAGTSAGAAALPAHMLVEGYGWRALRKGGIEVLPGLDLLPNLLLDQHFVERGRFGRLTHALLAYPACLGLGLAEETGVVVLGRAAGRGVRRGRGGGARWPGPRPKQPRPRGARGGPVSAQNVRLHLLVPGQHVDLRTGVVS